MDNELEDLWDGWFYEFATEEPDGSHTLILSENNDGEAYTKFAQLIQALCQSKCIEALRQLQQEMRMQTVPEGYDLITRSYLNNSIDFMVNELSAGRWAASPSHPKTSTKGQKE